jgi:hypothetical protein
MLQKAIKGYKRVTQQIGLKIKKFQQKTRKILISFYKEHKIKIEWTAEFFAVVFMYGVILNFMLHTLFDIFEIGFRNILALGFLFYFVKEEIPRIITKCKTTK